MMAAAVLWAACGGAETTQGVAGEGAEAGEEEAAAAVVAAR
jgi:hypothetical protein